MLVFEKIKMIDDKTKINDVKTTYFLIDSFVLIKLLGQSIYNYNL